MRTAAEFAFELNTLNGNAVSGRYNGVTEKQIAFVMAEARKIRWTDKKPDRPGKWFYRNRLEAKMGQSTFLTIRIKKGVPVYGAGDFPCSQLSGQWSDSPIPQPEEGE